MTVRCWCEIVNGRRHIADGCPEHDNSARLDSKHILVDVELDAQTDDDDVRYHEGKIRRVVQELCPDAHVSVRSGGVRWFNLGEKAA